MDYNYLHIFNTSIRHLSHWIYKILEENFSEDPLKLWSRNPHICGLKLKDPNIIIRVKSMTYTKKDIDEFDTQIKVLLDK